MTYKKDMASPFITLTLRDAHGAQLERTLETAPGVFDPRTHVLQLGHTLTLQTPVTAIPQGVFCLCFVFLGVCVCVQGVVLMELQWWWMEHDTYRMMGVDCVLMHHGLVYDQSPCVYILYIHLLFYLPHTPHHAAMYPRIISS